MNFDPDPILDAENDVGTDPLPRAAGARMVSLRFLRTALRRRRMLWIGLAVIGLVIGVGYHVAVPIKYSATTTLYLTAPAGTDETVAAANNLAMLGTAGVGQRAIAILHEPNLTPGKLLGKAPGTAVSDNVLAVTITGSSSEEAVRRANAVAEAFLDFRTQQFDDQNQSVVSAANAQITKLETQIDQLTAQINALGTGGQGTQAASLVAQRTAATTQVTSLQQAIQTDNYNTLSVSKGSRVITPATASASSKKKVLVLDGLTGLVVGLALGLGIVILQAVLSDRLRRREDVAAVLGVPVAVSVGPVGRRRFRYHRSLRSMARSPDRGLRILAHYLRARLAAAGPRPTELTVVVGDERVPAASFVILASELSSVGRSVVLVDATASRVLGGALAKSAVGTYRIDVGGGSEFVLEVAHQPWEPGASQDRREAESRADVVLVLATVDPALGAWHLRPWAADASLAVTAGRATAQQLDGVVEMLAAADIKASSAMLIGADRDDESVGLPRTASWLRRRVEPVDTDAVLPA